MDVLVIVSNAASGPILRPLAEAFGRANVAWAAFFTGEGVRLLEDEALVPALASAREAVVCGESWGEIMEGRTCPITLGSQTNSSALVGAARRIVGL